MTVVAFVQDLMFRSKIDGAVRADGHNLVYAGAGVDPTELIAKENPELVLVDLGTRGIDPIALIETARKSGNTRIIAFGSHVEHDTLERARAAGADLALPRSTFTRDLAALVRGEGLE